ncbi:hypothetical protein LR48_Vigan01g252800 [Vigna angularis]|uniref:Uncharacterized protein n=1 Tax=Phaseolus angularis TaxID=3914 RepID=A0A0L9TRD7_PHAAN|nr:hypothetical protein LR48_Vigan01g252800 [Vigna angularis]
MDLLTFFQNALHNPTLLQQITRKIQSMDLLVYNKKRRLPPRLDDRDHVAGNTFVECFGTEYGNVSHHEFFETAKTFYALFESFQTQSSKFKLRCNEDTIPLMSLQICTIDEGRGTMTGPASVLGFGLGLGERRSSRWWKWSGFVKKFGLRRRGRRGRWSKARGAF